MRGSILHIARVIAALVLAGCSSPAVIPAPTPAPMTLAESSVPENLEVYRAAGFVVGSGGIPFVGLVRYAATEFLDSTAVLITVSVPPRSLSFVRAGDRYAAFYSMRIDMLRGDAIVRSDRSTGEVRVASFAETTRGDEGIIFQRIIRTAPGTYALRVIAQDSLGSGTASSSATISVPAMQEGSISSIMPVFMAEPRETRNAALTIVPNPRATARYGRDSVLELYLESYGATAPDTLIVTARRESTNGFLAADTVVVRRNAPVRAGSALLPVHKLDLGSLRVTVSRSDGTELDSLTGVVNLGVEMPVTTIQELLEAMRYFASDADLQRLRAASPAARPALWAALVRRTDPNAGTPDNEALLEYARRLRVAERLYGRANRHGWQTDRGSAVAALGEPDYMTEPQPADSLGSSKVVTWEYRRHRLFLVFTDVNGPDSWRFTTFSFGEFKALLALAGPCVGCR
jgi:GWxTD domain-containing protein